MALVLAWPMGAWAATVPTSSTTYAVPAGVPTLADAVALAIDGDRIEVDASYFGVDPQLVIDRVITIVGVGGVPTLRSSDPDGLFLIDGGSLVLDHVAFDGQNVGRAVHIVDGSATITESALSDVTATEGGAILVENAVYNVLVVQDTTFYDGSVTGNGGFVRLKGGSATLERSTFGLAQAAKGAHVSAEAPASLVVGRCSFSSGIATGEAGAIHALGSADVSGSYFLDNAAVGGGGALRGGGDLVVSDSWFQLNHSTDDRKNGGAIWHEGGTITLERVFFCDNDAAKRGGALYVRGTHLDGSELVFALNENTGNDGGGAIWIDNDSIAVPAANHRLSHVTLVANLTAAGNGHGMAVAGVTDLVDGWIGQHTEGPFFAAYASAEGKLLPTFTTFSENAGGDALNVDLTGATMVETSDFPVIGITPSGCDLEALIPDKTSDLFGSASDGLNRGGLLGAGHWPDADGDGFLFLEDCDEDATDGPTIYPGAVELEGDGIDQDCDGTELCYVDGDGDQHGELPATESYDLDCSDPGEAPANDDVCFGVDDRIDADGDLRPDGCDACPLDPIPYEDTDNDGVCESVDLCQGYDDLLDTDQDGVPNGCDDCSSPADDDGDGVPNDCDNCVGFDDNADRDGDGRPDDCDDCPDDLPPDDDDGDEVCDTDDACEGYDDALDFDGDGIPDGCDGCPEAEGDDTDGDGVCDPEDPCPLDAPDDPDQDGMCTSTDPCPDDPDPECAPMDRSPVVARGPIGCECRTGSAPVGSAAGTLLLLAAWVRRRR